MRACTKLWTMRDGTKIRVCDMSDRHLVNAIRMIERNHERTVAAHICEGYRMLGMLSGEMAIDALERDIDTLEQGDVEPGEFYPIYDDMVEDAVRRGLKLDADEPLSPVITPEELQRCRRGDEAEQDHRWK